MTSAADPQRLGAVIVAGGKGARLGGADKADLEIDGVTLLERALHAVMSAADVVVVGDERPTTRAVTWARESPAYGGPAAGLVAGLAVLDAALPLVVVLAVDLPRVEPGTIARLTWAVESSERDGAVLVDETGRRQPLCGVYRRAALDRAASGVDAHGLAVHRLLADLDLIEVAAVGREGDDVDTWADLG